MTASVPIADVGGACKAIAMDDRAKGPGKVVGIIGVAMLIVGHNIYQPSAAPHLVFWTGIVFLLMAIFLFRPSGPKGT